MSQNMAKRTWGAWQRRTSWSELVMNGRWMYCSVLETDADSLCGSEFQQCQFLLEKSMNSLMLHMDRGVLEMYFSTVKVNWKCTLFLENVVYILFWIHVKTMLVVVSLLARVLLHSSTYQITFHSGILGHRRPFLLFFSGQKVVISKTTAQFSYVADPILIDLHLYKVLL